MVLNIQFYIYYEIFNCRGFNRGIKKFPKDTLVAVQYRDSGGEYYGSDDEIYLTIDGDGTLLL